jgi:hypothetical protein
MIVVGLRFIVTGQVAGTAEVGMIVFFVLKIAVIEDCCQPGFGFLEL